MLIILICVHGAAAAVVCGALLALAGCSLGSDEEAQPARGAPREIARLVDRLERATARRDFRTICDELFSSAAKRRAGGRDCASLLRDSAQGLSSPRIDLLGIVVKEKGARVRVRSRARGQRPLRDTIEVVRERGRYRIESLAG